MREVDESTYGTGRIAEYPRRRCGFVASAHLVAHATGGAGDGRAHRRAVSQIDRARARYRISRCWEKRHVCQSAKTGQSRSSICAYSTQYAVENSLSKAKDKKGLLYGVAKFLKEGVIYPIQGNAYCHRHAARRVLAALPLPQASAMALDELSAWVASVPDAVPCKVRDMARAIVGEMAEPMRRLQQLGLGISALTVQAHRFRRGSASAYSLLVPCGVVQRVRFMFSMSRP